MGSSQAVKSAARRCPACGHRVTSPEATTCPLCQFDFGDDRVTGVDLTPYAKAYASGTPSWRRMCEWVWFVTGKRFKHIALMRASAASRRFARVSILLLALALGLGTGAQMGWHWVTLSPALGPTAPTGKGWLHVAAAPRPLPPGQKPEAPVDLWWNPEHAAIAGATAFLLARLLGSLLLILIRAGATKAHRPPYDNEQRMTAALHYSTAWCVPIVLGALVLAFRPIAFVGTMARWAWYPPDRMFILSGAVLGGFGAVLWWFWLIRLGATAPVRTQGRVVAFFSLAAPALTALAAGAWWYGQYRLYAPLFNALELSF